MTFSDITMFYSEDTTNIHQLTNQEDNMRIMTMSEIQKIYDIDHQAMFDTEPKEKSFFKRLRKYFD